MFKDYNLCDVCKKITLFVWDFFDNFYECKECTMVATEEVYERNKKIMQEEKETHNKLTGSV